MKEIENSLIPVYEDEKGNQLVNGRRLHDFLKVQQDFSDWIKSQLKRTYVVKNKDYFVNILKKDHTSGTKYLTEYNITIETAKAICYKISNNPNTFKALSYLNKFSNKEIIIKEPLRKEYRFKEMLYKITGLEWQTQYAIPNPNGGFYKLDFYLKNVLIVEYDEKRHAYNSLYSNDNKRTDFCIDWLSRNKTHGYRVPTIRVKEGYELEGLNVIIQYLIHVDVLKGKPIKNSRMVSAV